MPGLDRDGEVFVLDLGDGENRFNGESVAAISALLDEVEGRTPASSPGDGCVRQDLVARA